ncbi:MAG: hypothetical protein UT39_C0002G0026 [Candidatus Woesebacteria bacterium GW2011_GWA1_39_21]|uniref:Uncharacterized protein n=1 Tax=Candidatus Woesebacteria bacterium GW2011_GWA1_39_21 TaxID=1618550 RepID=A0A0G0QN78_9BACT|nr:MAG: hypothetical protein UT39_C0002G0026 [Candidatus Woesebacteria bacterium GW2011_GWA1_39_21]
MRFNKLRFLQNVLTYTLATLITLVWMYVTLLVYQNRMLKQYSKEIVKTKPNATENTTDNWKTYKNDKWGFEFMYPSDWESQSVNSKDIIFQLGEYFDGGDPGGSSPMIFYISTQPYERTFAQDIISDGTEIISQESVNIDNKTFQLNTHKQFEVESAYKIIDYIPVRNLKPNDLYLYFSHTSAGCSNITVDQQSKCNLDNEANVTKYKDLRNQILSTFNFTEEPTPTKIPIDTSDWQTYSDQNYSFKYPNGATVHKDQGAILINLETSPYNMLAVRIEEPKNVQPNNSFKEYVQNLYQRLVGSNRVNVIRELTKTKINVYNSYIFSYETEGFNGYYLVQSNNNPNLFAEITDGSSPSHIETVDPILSTFNFTE